MRKAGSVVAQVKSELKELIGPGIMTIDLDRLAEKRILELGANPSFKGYTGGGSIPFPATVCVSVNEEIVHGIPSKRVLRNGDIVSVDVGAVVDGFHGDSAFTMGVGEISEKASLLIEATNEALLAGISNAKDGCRIGDISSSVQNYAEDRGYSVVRQYAGHGIGRQLHEEPQVPNYGIAGRGPMLKQSMTIAIEPMLNIGDWDTIELEDGWTVSTADGSLSAHFEETIAITKNGPEVLTSLRGGSV